MQFAIIFLCIWVGLAVFLPLINRITTIKITGKGFFIFLVVILIGIMLYPVFKNVLKIDFDKGEKADGFEISKYALKLDVDSKQKIEVEEDITVNWTEEGHHGIYKFTPEWLKYTSKNGRTISRKSNVSYLRAEIPIEESNNNGYYDSTYEDTYKYSLDVVKDKPRIKIGSSDYTLPLGKKDYVIKYTYDMGSDPYEGYDEFIFHAYGDYWGTEINNASIEITMPKSIKGNTVHFYADKFRKKDVTEYVDYRITDNKLYATFNAEKYLNEKGKYLEKSLTVDIELPENYFDNGSFNYGYLSLTCIIITLSFTFLSFILWLIFGKDRRKKIEVVNYLPPKDLSSAEIGYISVNGFSKKQVVSLIVELAAKKLIDIREKKGSIYIKKNKKNWDKRDNLNKYEEIVLNELIKDDEEFCLRDRWTFYTAFNQIEKELNKDYKKLLNDQISNIFKFVVIVLFIMSTIIMRLAYSYYEDLPQKLYNLYYVGFGSVFITLFFVYIMPRKTKKGTELAAEVNGFKKFLNTVEKDKLETLVEEMPDYFYTILPYTYVLGISKKWIEKFEDIKMPVQEYSSSINLGTFDYISDQMSTIDPTASSSGSSGGSSCGGGCSSCGGGCSSCGGGGSW